MRFGLNLPNFGAEVTPEVLATQASHAEEIGFDLLMVSDHIALVPEVRAGFAPPLYDPFVTLGWLAGRTHRIELGTTVIVLPYRHPLQTARLASNIDQLSGGRFVLGVAAGWSRQEFEALGVPFRRRARITRDYLEAIQALWSGEVVSFRSESVSFENVCGLRPARSPHPPIWVGGTGPKALRLAARRGDAWHPTSTQIEWIQTEGLPQLISLADEAGREVPAFNPRIKFRPTERRSDDPGRLPGAGSIDQIRGDLEQLAALGADSIIFDTTLPGEPRPPGTAERDHRWIELLADSVVDTQSGELR
jgi:probable F420-dependent oxidoreductase